MGSTVITRKTMSELSKDNPSDRFAGLAELYGKFRPSYPAAAIDFIVTRCALKPGSQLVDVGCGTGISSRLFAARGIQVIGIEPNPEMRAAALAFPTPPDHPKPSYRVGRAEDTGMEKESADAVLAAQAFHWFDAEVALREFHRILKRGGWAILMWNERDESDPATAAYGAVIRTAPEAAAVERPRYRAGEALLTSSFFQEAQRLVFPNEQALAEEGLLGRAFSASYAPRQADLATEFAKALRAVFARYQRLGKMVIRYQASVYVGRRRDDL
jgi:ubiquinone/menaquinone biosynthesis C-methylase UbiE